MNPSRLHNGLLVVVSGSVIPDRFLQLIFQKVTLLKETRRPPAARLPPATLVRGLFLLRAAPSLLCIAL